MAWINIFKALLANNKTMTDVNERIKLYAKYGVISEAEKIEIYAILLHEGYFTESDLDTYVTQGYITEQEKADIIASAAAM